MIRKLLIALALLMPAIARAEWHEAVSTHFIVYSQGPSRTRPISRRARTLPFRAEDDPPVPAGQATARLRVFLLQDQRAVGRLVNRPSVAGYYVSDARGLMLVGTRRRISGFADIRSARNEGPEIDPESVLFHEYTHHFTRQYFPATYPVWYSEGFAEFWGATRILPGDIIEVGAPADHRFSTFRALGWLHLRQLLTAHNYSELRGTDIFLLYAEGWLLVRYLFENPERQRQIQEYLRLINAGTSFEEAVRRAIPDLEAFNSALYEYAGRARYNVVRLPFRRIDVGPIAARTLRPAEQALILDEIKLSQGYPQREAAEFATHVRETAAAFPDDPFAIRMVMETQFLAGNNAEALAAAERLLALEPDHARALAMKGRIQIAALAAARATDAAQWNGARSSGRAVARGGRPIRSCSRLLPLLRDARRAAARGRAERALFGDGAGAQRRRAALRRRPRFRAAPHDPGGDRDHPAGRLRDAASPQRIGRRPPRARAKRGPLPPGRADAPRNRARNADQARTRPGAGPAGALGAAHSRHCERSEAIQCDLRGPLDCFVATLLAMTIQFSCSASPRSSFALRSSP